MSDVVLTKEQEEALSRCAPIRMARDFDYTPKAYAELPDEYRPVFKLRTLAEHERLALGSSKAVRLSFDGDDEINTGLYSYGVCKFGVRGWDNYRVDIKDAVNVVKWEGAKSVDLLPYALILELSNEILSTARLTKDEERGLR